MKNFITTLSVAALAVFFVHPSCASIEWDSASPDNNIVIPDNSPNVGAASDIYISPADSQLAGIANPTVASVANVTFTIVGGWDGDYTVVLIHTDGGVSQSVTLLSMIGSTGGANASSGFSSVTLAVGNTDINSAPSSSGTAITGTWAPEGGANFDSFQNVSATGDWILYVTDNQAGDQGTLANWSLNLNVVPEPVNLALVITGGLLGLVSISRAWRKRTLIDGLRRE